MIEQFKTWFENTPNAVVIMGVSVFIVAILLAWLIKSLKSLKFRAFYEVAKKLKLQVISSRSGRGIAIPRIVGFHDDRNIEIAGYDKYAKKLILSYVRIKISHKAYIVRKIEMEYSPGDNPSLQRIFIESEECSKSDLLKRQSFDEKLMKLLDELFKKYAKGEANQNSFITFSPESIDFDRAVTMVGDEEHIMGAINKLREVAIYMEEKGN